MATDAPERSLEESTRELLAVLREIEAAVEPPGPRRLVRPPTPQGLVEFTSEIGIPAAILVLRTNVAALELLQRSLRMLGDHEPRDDRSSVRDRATEVASTSLSGLDAALADLGSALDAGSGDRSPDELLEEARRRTEELEAQLESTGARGLGGGTTAGPGTAVDVEAELESLRQSVDRSDATPDDGRDDSDDAHDDDGNGDG